MKLLPDQQSAFEAFKRFCNDPTSKVFILKGYAGTGKTTLMKTFIDHLVASKNFKNGLVDRTDYQERIVGLTECFVPLASTGRAAKILGDKIRRPTSTIHSYIYHAEGLNRDIAEMEKNEQKGIETDGQLLLNFGLSSAMGDKAIYIIDESSMISNTVSKKVIQARFGSGKLLSDLFAYDPNGKFVFIGDDCQLPPVEGSESPALSANYIRNTFHYNVTETTLTEIVRQGSGNDIIDASKVIRQMCFNPPPVDNWAKFPLSGYENIVLLDDENSLISRYVSDVKQQGYNYTTLISQSNKVCTDLAKQARRALGFDSTKLMVGELLLVTQNNIPTGLMNGDLVKVCSIGRSIKKANLTFLTVEVEEISTKRVFSTMLIEELLYTAATNLDSTQQKNLFIDFYHREQARDIAQKSKQFQSDMYTDAFLNALRAVYGYALTCHKAQGGEWKHVYLDFPRRLAHQPGREEYQWLYTAITRASETLYINDGFYIE